MNYLKFQKEANILSFEEDKEYQKRKKVLTKIYYAFKENNIKWGLACSSSLFLYGLVDEFNNFDLLVDSKSIEKSKKVLKDLGGILEEFEDSDCCRSNYFYEFTLDGVDIDVISGFRLITFNTQYLYEYSDSETEVALIDGMKINLVSLEAQFILYAMMEGWQAKRRYIRELIQKHLEKNGLKFPNIFERELEKNLPGWIKREIRTLISRTK